MARPSAGALRARGRPGPRQQLRMRRLGGRGAAPRRQLARLAREVDLVLRQQLRRALRVQRAPRVQHRHLRRRRPHMRVHYKP